MNILVIGDVVGRPGRDMVRDHVDLLRRDRKIDLIIANVENAAAGFGLTPLIAEDFFSWGVDVLTSGNHIYDKKEIIEYIARTARLLRPANYPPQSPGSGLFIGKTSKGIPYAVINLQGRIFMPPSDCPFQTAQNTLEKIPDDVKVRLVDMHGEATSEKQAMGWYLDGRVSAVVGTHTHVPTADEHILPRGTAFLCDIGMTGPYDSVIGVDKNQIIQKFFDQMPRRFETATGDPRLSAVLIEVDELMGRARSIERVVIRG
ncbi:MAG: TIGR00282 family metallophosphoesterase [Acidobacteriia bacterium]|nr:TIGR00282 family metallophosphoesterase [Terriglobia bacterium]